MKREFKTYNALILIIILVSFFLSCQQQAPAETGKILVFVSILPQAYFMERIGGERATQVCKTRATILARRELGESLIDIARDLEMPYETVKTYVKLARRVLNS